MQMRAMAVGRTGVAAAGGKLRWDALPEECQGSMNAVGVDVTMERLFMEFSWSVGDRSKSADECLFAVFWCFAPCKLMPCGSGRGRIR